MVVKELTDDDIRRLNQLEELGLAIVVDQGIDCLVAQGQATQLESAVHNHPESYLVFDFLPNRTIDGQYIGMGERLHAAYIDYRRL